MRLSRAAAAARARPPSFAATCRQPLHPSSSAPGWLARSGAARRGNPQHPAGGVGVRSSRHHSSISSSITAAMAAGGGSSQVYSWEPWQASMESLKRVSPAAERNKEPILAELRKLLPPAPPAASTSGDSSSAATTPSLVLELASGTGQHVAHFASALPHLQWQPSDIVPDSFDSIRAYAGQLTNVAPPLLLDASLPPEQWPALPAPAAAVVAANVTHISPWPVTLGLVRGAGHLLQRGGLLFIYGPFTLGGRFTSDSNAAFHHTLVSQDPAWGYRDVQDVAAAAEAAGFARHGEASWCRDMPANNHALVFVKQ